MTADAQLSLSALRIATEELKKVRLCAMGICAIHVFISYSLMARVQPLGQGLNTMKYSDVMGKINGRLGPDYQYDRLLPMQPLCTCLKLQAWQSRAEHAAPEPGRTAWMRAQRAHSTGWRRS